MGRQVKAWASLEGMLLWLVPVIVLLLLNQRPLGLDIAATESSGLGRVSAFPGVSAIHLFAALVLLFLMGLEGETERLIRFVLGVGTVCLGLYSLWWPGVMATSFPLAIGSLFAALHAASGKSAVRTE